MAAVTSLIKPGWKCGCLGSARPPSLSTYLVTQVAGHLTWQLRELTVFREREESTSVLVKVPGKQSSAFINYIPLVKPAQSVQIRGSPHHRMKVRESLAILNLPKKIRDFIVML